MKCRMLDNCSNTNVYFSYIEIQLLKCQMRIIDRFYEKACIFIKKDLKISMCSVNFVSHLNLSSQQIFHRTTHWLPWNKLLKSSFVIFIHVYIYIYIHIHCINPNMLDQMKAPQTAMGGYQMISLISTILTLYFH